MARLDTLPVEMINAITQYLDVESVLQLKQASRDFYAAVSFHGLPKSTRKEFLAKADRFPQNVKRYACFKCLRMLPDHAFGRGQQKGKFANGYMHGRFCLDCAAKLHLYGHGRIVRTSGKEVVHLCYKCNRYGTRSKRCGVPGSNNKDFEAPDWVCWSEHGAVGTPSLVRLPQAALSRIVSTLSYKDAIALASTCAALRLNINHSDVALHERFRFTRDMSLRVGPGQNQLACYVCFRVLPGATFTEQQLGMSQRDPTTFYKRRCGDCLWKLYANPNSDKLLKEWNSRIFCNRCYLLKRRDLPCLGCSEGADEPTKFDNVEHEMAKKREDELRRYSLRKKVLPRDEWFSSISKVLNLSVSWASFEETQLELDLLDPASASEATSASTAPGQRVRERGALLETLRGKLRFPFKFARHSLGFLSPKTKRSSRL